jgi:hypothetical protein
LNGVATLATARANPMLRQIPVIMLVPRELSAEQMSQLTASVSEVTGSGEVPIRPLVELLRSADRETMLRSLAGQR